MKDKIAIIGTGAYGTCLANVLADNNYAVKMYGVNEQEINNINQGNNYNYFGNLPLNKLISASNSLTEVIENCNIIILAVPVKVIKTICQQLNKILTKSVVIINTAKGLDPDTGNLLSVLIHNQIKPELLAGYGGIYGPSIAKEVINHKKTCVMAVSENIELAKKISLLLNNKYFFVFPSNDVIAAEYAAALKNVIAVAAGIFFSFSESDNANASFLTLGLNEIKNIAVHFGAQENSFFNYACLADLILTASSFKSRNFSFGHELAVQRKKLSEISISQTVEGIMTCKTVYQSIIKEKISAPILTALYKILFENHEIKILEDIFA